MQSTAYSGLWAKIAYSCFDTSLPGWLERLNTIRWFVDNWLTLLLILAFTIIALCVKARIGGEVMGFIEHHQIPMRRIQQALDTGRALLCVDAGDQPVVLGEGIVRTDRTPTLQQS